LAVGEINPRLPQNAIYWQRKRVCRASITNKKKFIEVAAWIVFWEVWRKIFWISMLGNER
jgi:hypothetical protein